MRPKVINIKSASKDWMTNPSYQYIGRRKYPDQGIILNGVFGNPHPVGVPCHRCGPPIAGTTPIIHQRGETLPLFEEWLREEIKNPTYRECVKNLAGKTLVCYCKPNPCHGDILAQVCIELNVQKGMTINLSDNEYLAGPFVNSHYGWYYVFDTTETHILIKHDQSMSPTWLDKRAIYNVKEGK